MDGALLVELKAAAEIHPVHEAQLLTYLRLSGIRVGLLINFNAVPFGAGVVRKVMTRAVA